MSPAVLTPGVVKLEKALPASSSCPRVTAAVAGANGHAIGSQRKIPVVTRSGGVTVLVVVLDVEVVVTLVVVTLLDDVLVVETSSVVDVVLVEVLLVDVVLVELDVVVEVVVTPDVVATNATCPTSEMATAVRTPPYSVPPGVGKGSEGSPCSATVTMAPTKGFRKMPITGASPALWQSSFVEALNAIPKVLAASPVKPQSLRPGRSGTRSLTRASVSSMPVPELQLPSPPVQRNIPAFTSTPMTTAPPEIVAWKTTSPVVVILASEKSRRSPVPGAGTGSPRSATTAVVPSPR